MPESVHYRYLQDVRFVPRFRDLNSHPHDCMAIACSHWGISPALDCYVVKFTNILAFEFLIFQKHTSILGSEIFPVFLYPLLVSFYHLILEAGCHLFCKD